MSDVRAELRALVDDVTAGEPAPEDLWATLTGLGLHTIGVPEESGGSGGEFADLAVVVHALARAGVSAPLAEHAVAAWALAAAGADTDGGLLTVGDRPGAGGPVPAVPWGRDATGLIVLGPGGRVGLVRLDSRATVLQGGNIAGEPRDIVDPGDAAPVPLAGVDADTVRARIGLLRAAALAGACAGAYELTRVHVRNREQFGRPLLDIPAVSTALATMKVACLQADAAVERALARWPGDATPGGPAAGSATGVSGEPSVADASVAGPLFDSSVPEPSSGPLATAGTSAAGTSSGPSADALAATAVARVVAGEAAGDTARIAHQLHGAMGVTREYALHHLTLRMWAWRDEDRAEESWARLLGARAHALGETGLWELLTA